MESNSLPPPGHAFVRTGPRYESIAELRWDPDEVIAKQVFVRGWMENAVRANVRGDAVQGNFCELLPPETLFS